MQFSSVLFKITGLGFLVLLLVPGCNFNKEVQFSGRTMGTTYHVKVVTGYFNRLTGLEKKIENILQNVNKSMSVHMKDSEISRFNALDVPGKPFGVSEDFWYVMMVSRTIYQHTEGAWDGAIFPLVRLWKFNMGSKDYRIPDQAKIEELLPETGFRHIEFPSERILAKKKIPLSVDLSSIAKGYGVDKVVELLRKEGVRDFLVEIGGEVFASGRRKDGGLWKIGINTPQKDAHLDAVYKVIALENKALATSGNYRNFFEAEGTTYSHILDPRTGWPVSNEVVSVSIIADQCVVADGLATGIMVMGHEKGIELIDRLDGVEGLIVVQTKDGLLIDYQSRGFKAAEQ